MLYDLNRRDSGRLVNEAFMLNPIVCLKQWFSGLKSTNCVLSIALLKASWQVISLLLIIYLSIHMFIYLSIYLFILLFIYLFVCLFIYLFMTSYLLNKPDDLVPVSVDIFKE